MLWTDYDNRSFIEENYPAFLSTYDSYSYNIQRADAIRYFILHKYGGVYADIDIECLQSIEPLTADHSFVACYEPKKHAKWHGLDRMVSNAFMASVPNHPLIEQVLIALAAENPNIQFHYEVLKSTGPILLSNVLERYGPAAVTLFADHVMSPLTSCSKELGKLIKQENGYLEIKEILRASGTYGIHYWANSWERNLAGQLKNPDPFNVQGYVFHQGVDSSGYDIGNVGRNIDTLVRACNENDRSVAFNTDGFLKYYLKPQSRWSLMKNAQGNEGLYVKIEYHHILDFLSKKRS